MSGVAPQPTTIFPVGASGPSEDACCIHRVVGVGDTPVELTVEGDQSRDQRIARPRFTAVCSPADIAVVDAEMDVTGVGHRAVTGRAASDLQVDPAAAERVEFGQHISEHPTHRPVTSHPYRN